MATEAPTVSYALGSLLADPQASHYARYLSTGVVAGYDRARLDVRRSEGSMLARWSSARSPARGIEVFALGEEMALFVFTDIHVGASVVRFELDRQIMFNCVLSGGWRQTAPGWARTHPVRPNQCSIIPGSGGWIDRHYDRPEPYSVVTLVCSERALLRMAGVEAGTIGRRLEYRLVHGEETGQPTAFAMDRILRSTATAIAEGGGLLPLRQLFLKARIHDLVHGILRQLIEDDDAAPSPRLRSGEIDRLEAIRREIDEAPACWPTLHALSRASGLHPNKLSAAFQALYGETIYQYGLNARMRLAREMLSAGELSVSEVADAVGYQELPSFTRMFRARFGMTPSAARKRAQISSGAMPPATPARR